MKIVQLNRRRRTVIHTPVVFSTHATGIVIPYKPLGVVITLLLLFLCLYLFFRSDFFMIHTISAVRSEEQNQVQLISVETLIDDLIDMRGRSLFSVDTAYFRDQLLEKHRSLEAVRFDKKLPDRIIITFTERKAAAVIRAKNGSFILDSTGYIYAPMPEELRAPVFQDLEKEVVLGEHINSRQAEAAINLVTGFNELELFTASTFNFTSYPTVVITTSENVELLFSGEIEISEQLATLQLIVKNATIEGKSPNRIDLRFKRPVVSY